CLTFLLKTPCRAAVLNLVSCDQPCTTESGCVVALCHGPWLRLLAVWCRHTRFGQVFASGKWAGHAGLGTVRSGVANLRRVVRQLRGGGRVVVLVDQFPPSGHTRVTFLGQSRAASLLAARLAAIAVVPIHAVLPQFNGGRVRCTLRAVLPAPGP